MARLVAAGRERGGHVLGVHMIRVPIHTRADLLLMGWHGGFTVGRIHLTPVQRVMASVQADMGVLKDRGLDRIDSIVLPWGGGPHARLGLEVAVRTARATGAAVHVLRIVKPEVDAAARRSGCGRLSRRSSGRAAGSTTT